jgi:FkbM family methyltransferase
VPGVETNLAVAGLSEDGLLDRRIRLRQPKKGYRAGSDAVLLAAAVPARAGERVLDVGAGAGAVALCLAWRCPEATVCALERDAELCALAAANAAANELSARVRVLCGDVAAAPAELRQARFDHVVTNPPFYEAGRVSTSPEPLKHAAHAESEAGLADWLAFCLKRLRPGGSLSVIHRASRLPELLSALHGGAGDIAVLPLWPAAGRPAKRVIVQARAGRRGPARLLSGLVLHDGNGGDTAQARALLREGAALPLDESMGREEA